MIVRAATVILVISQLAAPVFGQKCAVSKEEYLAYIIPAAEFGWQNLEASRQRWRQSIDLENVFGYRPPANDAYLAALCANLFEITSERRYLDRARDLLLYYGEYKKAYPPDYAARRAEYARGLPAIPDIFVFAKYVHAYKILHDRQALTAEQQRIIEQNIAESADFMIDFQEWGPMNRAMLRAEALLYAARALPDHPHRPRWEMLGNAIVRDNLEQWEIEDASLYNAIWLVSLCRYASYVADDPAFFRSPMMTYYFEYYLQLMSPAGIIPDFGDANWGSSWNRYIPFFEKGAAIHRDPRLRWAAAQIFRTYLDPLPENKNIFTALVLSDAVRWADFSLPAEPPTNGSREVLEDLVGKKMVFRDGWDSTSTYLLYNYRDEGDGGWLFREYLRTTIPVEEEKMHHGHSDENSIVLLMKNGSILLHDGGYRDFMPSGPYGAYRADYYHNRLAIRKNKIALGQRQGQFRYSVRDSVPGQTMLGFFRNSGAYRPVRTQKIDFLRLRHFDMGRTRLVDERLGYEWDRIVNYIKPLDWFVIFDVVRFTQPDYLTMANLWHTRRVVAQGQGWFDTEYDSLRNVAVAGDTRLLIYFPYREHLEEGVESQKRYYQDEKVIYQLIGRHGYLNDLQVFVTVLIPHGRQESPASLVQRVRLIKPEVFPKAAAVEIRDGDRRFLVGAKLDLQYELIRDWRRPMYTYESGRVRYEDYETDAYHLFVVEDSQSIDYAISGAVKITYKGRVLHEQRPVSFGLFFDGSPDAPGVGKLRYWEERVQK